jgi:Spy/CpxP family protein refolding chaperone
MLGLFFGTLCLVALIATLRRRRFAHYAFAHGYGHGFGHGPFGWGWRGHGGPGYGGYGHHGHHGHGPGRAHWARRFVFEVLDTTPGQEKVIMQAVDNVLTGMDGTGDELDAARKELAAAIGGDVLDEAALRAALDRALAVVQKAATELTQVVPAVHGALDGEQRKRLAELIAEGRRGFRARRWF